MTLLKRYGQIRVSWKARSEWEGWLKGSEGDRHGGREFSGQRSPWGVHLRMEWPWRVLMPTGQKHTSVHMCKCARRREPRLVLLLMLALHCPPPPPRHSTPPSLPPFLSLPPNSPLLFYSGISSSPPHCWAFMDTLWATLAWAGALVHYSKGHCTTLQYSWPRKSGNFITVHPLPLRSCRRDEWWDKQREEQTQKNKKYIFFYV